MNRTFVNIFSTVLLQVTTLISGMIIPRLILNSFGSEINGLVSSITQFLSYISLVEGGVSGVVMAALYKPLVEKNSKKISSVISAANKFFKRISLIFILYQIILGFIYPIIVDIDFSWLYISTLTFILGLVTFIQYCFSLTWRLLLQADNKVYISSIVQIIVVVLNTSLTIITIKIFPNIHLVKLITGLVYLVQPIIFNLYIHKNYYLDRNVAPDEKALSQRWNGFGINIAAFVHNNTDMVLLTLFTNLQTVSIYSVHYLVTNGLKSLILSISKALAPNLGLLYASKKVKELKSFYDFYEILIFYISFFLFTVGGILIVPFVLVYTKGINDTNYYQPLFAFFLMFSELIYCLREPAVNMAYSAGHFKSISKYAYVEASLNITVSIILVIKFGLIGVAIGTTISMSYRTIFQIIYLKHEIIFRDIKNTIKNLFLFSATSIIIILTTSLFDFDTSTILNWIIYAIIIFFYAILLFTLLIYIFYRNIYDLILYKMKKREN